MQIHEATAWMLGHKNLVELVGNTLSADYFDTLGITLKSLEGLVFDKEVKACGKADATEHSQWVVGKSNVWVERCADYSIVKVVNTSEWVNEFTKTTLVQTDSHSVDGKITTVLVIFKSTILNDRLARITLVAFLAGTYEFYFYRRLLNGLSPRPLPEREPIRLYPFHILSLVPFRSS